MVSALRSDSTPAWSILSGGGAMGVAANAVGFAVAGGTDVAACDFDPGAPIDEVPGNSSTLSRYAF